jgi:large subunit ribosomal protein L30
MSKAKKLKITQVKSVIKNTWRQKQTIKALGLQRIGHSVMHRDTDQIRGMIDKVNHLIRVEEV